MTVRELSMEMMRPDILRKQQVVTLHQKDPPFADYYVVSLVSSYRRNRWPSSFHFLRLRSSFYQLISLDHVHQGYWQFFVCFSFFLVPHVVISPRYFPTMMLSVLAQFSVSFFVLFCVFLDCLFFITIANDAKVNWTVLIMIVLVIVQRCNEVQVQDPRRRRRRQYQQRGYVCANRRNFGCLSATHDTRHTNQIFEVSEK